jgi:hypothetical protein
MSIMRPKLLMCGPFPGVAEHGSDGVIGARRLSDQWAGDIPASGTKDPSHGRGTDRRTACCCRTQEPKVAVVAMGRTSKGAALAPCPFELLASKPAQTVSPRNSTSSLAWCVSPGRLKLAKPVRKRRLSIMHNPSHIEARPLSEDQGFALFYPYCRPTRPLSARRTKSFGDIPMLGSPNLRRGNAPLAMRLKIDDLDAHLTPLDPYGLRS